MTKYRTQKPGKKDTYHTDPEECPMVETETMKEITDRYVEWHDMSECDFCADAMIPPNKGQSQ